MYALHNFDKADFLANYWQKKPRVIKQGLVNFVDPLDEHILAGLSQEGEVDSRIIHRLDSRWDVAHGPFIDINQHCVGAWTLLVQSVDQYVPEAEALLRSFDFIPHWRMDDLMVSFSNEGGGVGPHLDQYDVFIVQGKGARRWQVGLPDSYKASRPHPDLGQIEDFTPVIDQVLYPGDIVYIPANHPHNGIATGECLNYSVGFRAPSQQEMLSALADFASDENLLNERYQGQVLAPRDKSAELSQTDTEEFRALLHRAIDSPAFTQWLPRFLSQSLYQDADGSEEELSAAEVEEYFASGQILYRTLGVKPVWVKTSEKDSIEFYVEGQAFSCPHSEDALLNDLLCQPYFDPKERNNSHLSPHFNQLVSTLISSGYWYFE